MRWNFTHTSGSSGVSEPMLACVKRLDDIRTVTVWNYIVGAPVRHLWDWSAEEKWRTDFGAFLQIWTRFFIFFFKCLFLTWYIFRLWRDLNCFKTFFFFFFLVQQRIVLVYFTSIQINQRNEKRCVWFCIKNKTNNKTFSTFSFRC